MSEIDSRHLRQGGNETSKHETVISAYHNFLVWFSIQNCNRLRPMAMSGLVFSRNSVKLLSSAMQDQTREECCSLDVFFLGWKGMIIFTLQNVKAPEDMFFFLHRALVVMWSRAPGRFLLKDVLLAYFWPFVDIKDFFYNVSPSPNHF